MCADVELCPGAPHPRLGRWAVRDLNLTASIRDRSYQNRSQSLPFVKSHIDSSEFVGVADISGVAYR
jgi:hypothetical protein